MNLFKRSVVTRKYKFYVNDVSYFKILLWDNSDDSGIWIIRERIDIFFMQKNIFRIETNLSSGVKGFMIMGRASNTLHFLQIPVI